MKKWTALFLSAVLCLSLTACASTTAEEAPETSAPIVETEPVIETTAPVETEPAETETAEETPAVETEEAKKIVIETTSESSDYFSELKEGKTIAVGDTITTTDYEFTLTNVEFSYQVTPPNTSRVYESYTAESGMVFVHVEAQVKNLLTRDITIGELFLPSVLYDGQYSYAGMTFVNDGDNRFDSVSYYSAATPLETCTAHGLVQCPEEVYTSGKSVVVTLNLGGMEYKYTLR